MIKKKFLIVALVLIVLILLFPTFTSRSYADVLDGNFTMKFRNWLLLAGATEYESVSMNKKDNLYWYLTYLSKMNNNNLIDYNSFKNSDFIKCVQEINADQWTQMPRGKLKSDDFIPVTAEDDRIVRAYDWRDKKNNYRNICIQHSNGGTRISTVRMDAMIYINADGRNPWKVGYSERAKLNLDNLNNVNPASYKVITQWPYIMNHYTRIESYKYVAENYGDINNFLNRNCNFDVGEMAHANWDHDLTEFLAGAEDYDSNNSYKGYKEFLDVIYNYCYGQGVDLSSQYNKISGNLSTNLNRSYENGYTYIGPFKYKYIYKSGYTTFSYIVNDGTITGDGKFYSSSHTEITPTPNNEFYIRISGDHTNDDIEIKFKNSYRLYGGVVLFFTRANNSNEVNQNRAIYYPFYNDVVDTSESLKIEGNPLSLTIKKADFDQNQYETQEELKKAEFKITFNNVKSVTKDNNDTDAIGNKVEFNNVKLNDNLEIVFSKVIPAQEKGTVTITIEETVPSIYSQTGAKPLKLICSVGADGKYNISTAPDNEYDGSLFSSSKDDKQSLILTITNKLQRINLSGQVWIDLDEDGIKDTNETKLSGVKVNLYHADANGNKTGNIVTSTTTNETGRYMFTDVVRTLKGYKIEFEYNGLVYEETDELNGRATKQDSKAGELGRIAFNDKFISIEKDKAVGKNNEQTTLSYTYDESKQESNLATVLSDVNIQALTIGVHGLNGTEENIDLGLIEKEYDLEIENKLSSVYYIINTYMGENPYNEQNYNQADEKYYEKMEQADYEYRNTNRNFELNAQVKYHVSILDKSPKTNNGRYDTKEVTISYRYDTAKYELVSVDGKTTGYADDGDLEITLQKEENINKITDGIDIVFKLKRNASGDLPIDIGEPNGLDIETTAEIMAYETVKGGLIDKDSAPANGLKEDDIEDFIINFGLKNERKIEGMVAEAMRDSNNIPTQTLDSKPIDNVIVQLIEIVSIKNEAGEVISNTERLVQETKTGSGIVTIEGTGTTYNIKPEEVQPGKYVFNKMIPGNYIVRFIYGEQGTAIDEIYKYNGQDYKSTKNEQYKAEWYLDEEGVYSNTNTNQSNAIDNEARRLEVMAFSPTIDENMAEALLTLNEKFSDLSNEQKEKLLAYANSVSETENSVLHNMAGPIDNEKKFKDIQSYIISKTYMTAQTSKIAMRFNTGEVTGANLGLTTRPEAKLKLEKHLTALRITPTGTGISDLVDAKAKYTWDSDNNCMKREDITGIRNHLGTDISSRTNRGWWKLETDIEELTQGANLEAEYTYYIINAGEEDYLNKALIDSYNSNIETYKTDLQTLSNSINTTFDYTNNTTGYKGIGNNLGEYYYTYNKGGNDTLVPISNYTIEETLNNELSFVQEGSDFTQANIDETTGETMQVEKVTYDTNGNIYNPNKKFNTQLEAEVSGSANSINPGSFAEKKLKVRKTLEAKSLVNLHPYNSYIAEILTYSTPTGKRNLELTPGNLQYIHSEATDITLNSNKADGTKYNEEDEFWAEDIMIVKPTGGDKSLPIEWIMAISIAIMEVGILVIIKQYVKK